MTTRKRKKLVEKASSIFAGHVSGSEALYRACELAESAESGPIEGRLSRAMTALAYATIANTIMVSDALERDR